MLLALTVFNVYQSDWWPQMGHADLPNFLIRHVGTRS